MRKFDGLKFCFLHEANAGNRQNHILIYKTTPNLNDTKNSNHREKICKGKFAGELSKCAQLSVTKIKDKLRLIFSWFSMFD